MLFLYASATKLVHLRTLANTFGERAQVLYAANPKSNPFKYQIKRDQLTKHAPRTEIEVHNTNGQLALQGHWP